MTHRVKTPKTKHRNFFAEWNQRNKDRKLHAEAEHSFEVPAIAAALLNSGLNFISQDRRH